MLNEKEAGNRVRVCLQDHTNEVGARYMNCKNLCEC
jgi:hypothetical protein